MVISIEEDTIHSQDFQGLSDCIHSFRKPLQIKQKKKAKKGGLLDHFNQPINMDKTVTQLVEILSAFQNRFIS